MAKQKLSVKELSDEEVLKEFVNRFKCDAAVLIYLDEDNEFGFGRWCNGTGRQWVKDVLGSVKQHVRLRYNPMVLEEEVAVQL